MIGGLQVFMKLSKYSKMTTHELSVADVNDIASIAGITVDQGLVESTVEAFHNDSPKVLEDLISSPEYVEKLKVLLTPTGPSQFTIECPSCSQLGRYPHASVAPINPHVICRHCKELVDLSE